MVKPDHPRMKGVNYKYPQSAHFSCHEPTFTIMSLITQGGNGALPQSIPGSVCYLGATGDFKPAVRDR